MGAVSTKILSKYEKNNKIRPDPIIFRGSRHNYGTIVGIRVGEFKTNKSKKDEKNK